MADSIRNRIITQMVTVISSATTSTVAGRVFRSRAQAMNRDESPAVYVRPISDQNRSIVVPFSERDLFVECVIVVRSSDTPDISADPIAVQIHAALFADTTLGGRSLDIEESDTSFDSEDVDNGGGITRLRFRIYYRHTVEHLDS